MFFHASHHATFYCFLWRVAILTHCHYTLFYGYDDVGCRYKMKQNARANVDPHAALNSELGGNDVEMDQIVDDIADAEAEQEGLLVGGAVWIG